MAVAVAVAVAVVVAVVVWVAVVVVVVVGVGVAVAVVVGVWVWVGVGVAVAVAVGIMYSNTPPSQQPFHDFHASGYDLDYTLGGEHPAAIFSIAYCEYCYTRYAILPDYENQQWLLFDPKEHGAFPPMAKVISDGYAICVNYKCMSSTRILTVTSLTSVVTKDGKWLHLKQPNGYLV